MAGKRKQVELTLSDFAENFFVLSGRPLSLDDYPHMRAIYNTNAQKSVMKFSRQCVVDSQLIELANGKKYQAIDLQIGMPIIGFDETTLKNEVTSIKNVWDNGVKPCYKITTRMGHSASVTNNHPFWKINGWTKAEDIQVGDRIGVSWNNSCALTLDSETPKKQHELGIAAYLLAEEGIGPRSLNFTNQNLDYANELREALKEPNPILDLKLNKGSLLEYRMAGAEVGKEHPLKGMLNKTSAYKTHPDFIYDLTRSEIIEYLRIWWNTDGYISHRAKENKLYIGISLISEDLIKGLRTLLLKLGIPTRYSTSIPKIYEATDKKVHTLQVIGTEFKKKFLDLIPTVKKPEGYVWGESNSKPFFYPTELYDTFKPKFEKGSKLTYKRKDNISLDKLRSMSEVIPELKKIVEADHYYDEVTAVEYLGELSTTGIEIEKTHNFLIDHILTRNTSKSTTLANIMLARACLTPNFKQLYVSPAVAQTQEFARDKLEPVINNSPLIKDNFVNGQMVQNVLKKEFVNGSIINLRYALLNADRIRGISADVNYFDECYTPNMQILSQRGWLDFTEVKKEDLLGTINQTTRQLEWQMPTRLVEKPHDGYIISYENSRTALEVTPGHNVFIGRGRRPNEIKHWELVPACDTINTPLYMMNVPVKPDPATFQEVPKYFSFPGGKYVNLLGVEIEYPEFKLETKNLGKFIGPLLTSGRFFSKQAGIAVEFSKKGSMKAYSEFLKELGIMHEPMQGARKTVSYILVQNKAVEIYIKNLGTEYKTRRFPYELVHQFPSLVPSFIDGLRTDSEILMHTNPETSYYKTWYYSKTMAEAFQYLVLLTGIATYLNYYKKHETSRNPPYGVSLKGPGRSGDDPTTIGINNQANQIDPFAPTIKSYSGPVYCVTVPNGTVIVSNKSTITRLPFVSGNCQDLLKDVITVTEETMSRSLVKKSIYAGTPKRTKGTLADLWFNSTQNEYAVKSHRSGHWNILGPDNIGANGLIDKKTGLPLDLRIDKGEWVSTYDSATTKPFLEGYRVCLLHFAHAPWVDWQRDVITKMENTSTALFYNETLGLEYDSGAVPITKAEIIAACNSDMMLSEDPPPDCIGRPSIMGIDYGPVNSQSSFTCISIIQQRENKLQVVYAKKFIGKEADYSFIHEEIPKLFHKWNCILLASDYGMGEAPNSEFRNRLGLEKVISFQHLPTQKEPMAYNPRMRAYTLNKTFIMTKFFKMIKSGKLKFPNYNECANILTDLRNVLIEYDEEKNTERYTNVGPDDFVHATIFASVAAMLLFEGAQENLS